MKIETMKEKVDSILGSFLDRNKEYVVEAYINNGMTDSNIGRIIILTDRICKTKDNKFMIEWNKDVNSNVRYNNLSFPYDEVMACYEEVDSYGCKFRLNGILIPHERYSYYNLSGTEFCHCLLNIHNQNCAVPSRAL